MGAQRDFVGSQLASFRCIEEYPVEISPALQLLQENVKSCMLLDENLEEGIEMVECPE